MTRYSFGNMCRRRLLVDKRNISRDSGTLDRGGSRSSISLLSSTRDIALRCSPWWLSNADGANCLTWNRGRLSTSNPRDMGCTPRLL